MSRDLDPRLQQIIENAHLALNDVPLPGFSFPRVESKTTQRSLAEGSRRPSQENIMLNKFCRDSYSFEPLSQPVAPRRTTSRLSITPWSSQCRQERDQSSMMNADQHFRFTQNLRQGLPVIREAPISNNTQAEMVLDQLATNIFLQNPMSQHNPEPAGMSRNVHDSRINDLEPQMQQVTQPFNFGGYILSPNTQKDSTISSPSQFAYSSPTPRVNLRRLSHQNGLSWDQLRDDGEIEENTHPFETPRRQTVVETENVMTKIPQALNLEYAPPMAQGIQLISPHKLPDRFRQVFPYELFNAVQSKCFATVYKSIDNVVVSAPTGCGKTAILEMAICKLIESHDSGEFKIVYQAPTKALCSERLHDWQKKFNHLNLSCAELTGDTSRYEMSRVRNASIIVTTPEKWDSFTRKWQDHFKLLQMVKLFLIDEVHILKDARGATLEAVVSRMKSSGANVRFIALSATIPNSEDIAIWLGRDPSTTHVPAHRETFGEDFRPVKLRKHVYGFEGLMNDFAFEKVLDGKLPGLIQKHTAKKPIMIFCFTRKSCENTAAFLADWWIKQRATNRAWPAPSQRTAVISKELQEVVECGVAFHHAGLDSQDRNAIETAFVKGDVNVICCTSTLAVGINLPCHLVILKGTVGFQDCGLGEYSDLEVMQMLGRAGRPQFDNTAVAVIMTRSDKVQRYKKMVSGQEILESSLHLNLIEHLNSEIGLGTIYSRETARKWLSGTFLSVRMNRNPDYYKFEDVSPGRDVDERLRRVCERDVKLLQETRLITENEPFMCTEYGHAMSRYMVQFDTMKLLLSLPKHCKTEQILLYICQASELKDLRMKPKERPALREFNKSPLIKYPIKENISTTAQKISLIIQVQLGGIDFSSNKEFIGIRRQFMADKAIIFERVQRLVRCIIDCKSVECDGISTHCALDLARSLSAEFWENSNLQLRQIPQVGPAASRKLVSHNIQSVEGLAKLDTGNIERILSRNPPFGKKMLDSLHGFPCLTINTEITGKAASKSGENPKVVVKSILGYTNTKTPVWNGRKPSLTFTAEKSDGALVHFWRGNIQKLDKGHEIRFIAELSSPDDEIKCYVACDDIVGTSRSNILRPDIPPSAFTINDLTNKSTPQSQFAGNDNSHSRADEFGGDEFEDEELLEAVKHADTAASGYGSEDFADVDDLIGTQEDDELQGIFKDIVEPVQMENGKWACNHQCRGGKILKNGQLCKHKCCHDGIDKPRKPKKKSSLADGKKTATKSRDAKNTSLTTSKKSKGQLKLKVVKHDLHDEKNDVEMVDLADKSESPHLAYDLSPRYYLNERQVRFQKQKPKFSTASERPSSLSYVNNAIQIDDPLEFENHSHSEDFPSPSALLNIDDDAGFLFQNSVDEAVPAPADFFENSGATIPGLDNHVESITPAPEITSSFNNDIFDFSAFNDEPARQDEYSSPLVQTSVKRPCPPTPEPPQTKYRRVTFGEISSRECLSTQRETTLVEREVMKQRSIPAWVDEFDRALIDDLKGIVDFVD